MSEDWVSKKVREWKPDSIREQIYRGLREQLAPELDALINPPILRPYSIGFRFFDKTGQELEPRQYPANIEATVVLRPRPELDSEFIKAKAAMKAKLHEAFGVWA